MRASEQPLSVQCPNCGLQVQVPLGGKRLCGCGTWITGAAPPTAKVVAEPAPVETKPAAWPKIESDLAAIERLNEGYRRITSEMSKAVVGQKRVLEELLI